AFGGWAILLASHVALRTAAHASQGVVAVRLGAAVRQRLIAGALALDLDVARARGVGQWFGVVLESQWIESTALQSVFGGVSALLAVPAAVLRRAGGAGGMAWGGLVIVWLSLLGLGTARVVARCRAWTGQRFRMTYELIEKLLGHRTRVAQEPREAWHR